MIIIKLIGGLGNQLFQYALGRRLATINNRLLKLDVTGFETYKLHKYSLWAFNINEDFATVEEIQAMITRKKELFGFFLQMFHKKKLLARSYIKEKKLYWFDPNIMSLSDNVYLEGYWQSEMYFVGISETIRREYSVKEPLAGKDKEVATQIQNCNSVSVHIRRKDYVTNPKTKDSFGVVGLEYYKKAVEELEKRVKLPTYFVFTDDPQWAKDNLWLCGDMVFVDHNDAEKNYEDLRLMSQCKHNIIANSSFSWWGAWLNANPNKVVFAPSQWMNDRKCPDIIPKEWIQL